jgi:hypothetical protein
VQRTGWRRPVGRCRDVEPGLPDAESERAHGEQRGQDRDRPAGPPDRHGDEQAEW